MSGLTRRALLKRGGAVALAALIPWPSSAPAAAAPKLAVRKMAAWVPVSNELLADVAPLLVEWTGSQGGYDLVRFRRRDQPVPLALYAVDRHVGLIVYQNPGDEFVVASGGHVAYVRSVTLAPVEDGYGVAMVGAIDGGPPTLWYDGRAIPLDARTPEQKKADAAAAEKWRREHPEDEFEDLDDEWED